MKKIGKYKAPDFDKEGLSKVKDKKRKLIIHIGMHKTGSSSIQDSLHYNLTSKVFKYIHLNTPNHSRVMLELFMKNTNLNPSIAGAELTLKESEDRKNRSLIMLKDEILDSEQENLIISGEGISNLSEEELFEMKVFFNNLCLEISIVGYVRPPKGYNESAFQERLKAGLENVYMKGIYPYYRKKFEKFDKVFGKENIFLWKFNPKSFQDGDVVVDFCARLGIPIKREDICRVNESLSKEAIALLYVYRKYTPELVKGRQSIRENNAFIKYFKNIGKEKFKVSSDFINPILKKYKEDIIWMEERLGVTLDENFDYNENNINNEEDLENVALNSVMELEPIVDKQYLQKENDTTSIEGVVALVHALKLQAIDKMNKKETKINISEKEMTDKTNIKNIDHQILKKNVIKTLEETDSLIRKQIDMFEIVFDANGFCYYDKDNVRNSISKGGKELTYKSFVGGFLPKKILLFPHLGLHLLFLQNANSKAEWYLNSKLEYIGNSESIKLNKIIMYREFVSGFLSLYFNDFLFKNSLSDILKFLSTRKSFFHDILNYLKTYDVVNTKILQTTKEYDILSSIETFSYHLGQYSGREIQDRILRNEHFEIDKKVYNVYDKIILLSDMVYGYIFREDKTENFYIVFFGSHYSQSCSVYNPSTNLLIILDKGSETHPTCSNFKLQFQTIHHLMHHFFHYLDDLKDYFSQKSKSHFTWFRDPHFGHHLWNELSGLERIILNGDICHLDEIILLDSLRVQPFAPLSDIFGNELPLKITNNINNMQNFIQYVYHNNKFGVRITDNYISKSLINRFLCLIKNNSKKEINQFSQLTVVFGLRFENRTWINQREGFLKIAHYLNKLNIPINIIVDGHNSSYDKAEKIKSHLEDPSKDYILMEKELGTALANAELGKHVKIIDCIEMTLLENLEYLVDADFFIAPWGAGLVKYKWICNLPGVTFTNTWNMSNKKDLYIYDLSKYRENAIPSEYLSIDCIKQDNKDENINDRKNFIVNLDCLLAKINILLANKNLLIKE